MNLSRRSFLAAVAAALVPARHGAAALQLSKPMPFSAEMVRALAEKLAAEDYAPRPTVPEAWTDMDYDAYRTLWFRSEDALYAETDTPLRVDLLHPGLYYDSTVDIFSVENDEARRITFDLDLFDRTDTSPDLPLDDTLGYSGVRLRAELSEPGIFQEFAVFQGASYFRALARGMSYGLSARGLALGTASPEGEEFPDFTSLWIETPGPGETSFTVHALLDGPSVTGAFRFAITPGDVTDISVAATIFPRQPLETVGIAPLTSMFFFDETNRGRFDDYRQAVHDSDGLLIHNGAGEVLWRPLANPLELQTSAFGDTSPEGFGLLQRARRFDDYADAEAHYHMRPSLWIRPDEPWGPGAVMLVEIPTDKEFYDNIVAFWRPETPLEPGRGHDFAYRMRWGETTAPGRSLATVVQTRMGAAAVRGKVVVIEFDCPEGFEFDRDAVEAGVQLSAGTLNNVSLKPIEESDGMRLSFTFEPDGSELIEMRARLKVDNQSVSEVWLYRWTV